MTVYRARMLAMAVTSLVMIGGGVYALVHTAHETARLPIGGATSSPDRAVVELVTALLWLCTVILAGIHMLLALSQPETERDRYWRDVRGLIRGAHVLALVLVVGCCALTLRFSSIDWIRPAFYLPLIMAIASEIIALATCWMSRAQHHAETGDPRG